MSDAVADWQIDGGRARLWPGDCLQRLRGLDDGAVDAVVTDPPYGLSFMRRRWDAEVPSVDVWREALRVLKPGGHLLCFAGTRTHHRMACAIEDAGFEIRDMLAWVYGSGFPKSHNLQGDWQGWGTALKPAMEPITLARKPLAGTVAETVLQHGTGALNVDGCRVQDGTETGGMRPDYKPNHRNAIDGVAMVGGEWVNVSGRWPANLIHDGGEEVSGLLGDAARFFYSAKASKADREEGCEELEEREVNRYGEQGQGPLSKQTPRVTQRNRNHHPTVKPTDLMRYLCRLVTPPGGLVLDPFAGSGSTGKAAMLEGFRFLGIELDLDYLRIARDRIAWAFYQAEQTLFSSVGDADE